MEILPKAKGFNGWDYCYYCGEKLTDEDHDNYDPIMCCDGRECGCMGLPTDPPYCIKCSKGDKNEL